MEVILKQDVKNLGEKDDVVNVKPGYGRNFLLPQGMAVLATESNKKVLAENIRQAQFKQDKVKKDAEKIAEALKDVNLPIGTKAGENGKIFGAVNALQLAAAVQHLGYDVDGRNIPFDSDVKFMGNSTAQIGRGASRESVCGHVKRKEG